MSSSPRVSVVMPAYNAARFIGDAINSVLRQSFTDFELLVINDGSTDSTAEIVRGISDPRIRLHEQKTNTGLTAVRNEGLRHARGEFVAWLDSDDRSHSTRLASQVRFLENHPAIGACGSWVETFGVPEVSIWRYPTDPAFVRSRLLFDSPLATSSVMLRRALLVENSLGFDGDFPPAEDYDLWERLSHFGELANLPKILTEYRIHGSQTSTTQIDKQRRAVRKIQLRQLEKLRIEPSEREIEIHSALGRWTFEEISHEIEATEAWLSKLNRANSARNVFPETAFRRVLSERWFYVCLTSEKRILNAMQRFWGSELSFRRDLNTAIVSRYALRALKKISTNR